MVTVKKKDPENRVLRSARECSFFKKINNEEADCVAEQDGSRARAEESEGTRKRMSLKASVFFLN